MLRVTSLAQPSDGRIADALVKQLANPLFTHLDAGVAYATVGGFQLLRDALRHSNLKMRWLSSFDWCRSDPAALSALDQLPGASVRIHGGRSVVQRAGCAPTVPFHPKGFLFRGLSARCLVLGSGNLSRNGLTKGVELDVVIEVSKARSSAEKQLWTALGSTSTWFNSMWSSADAYSGLADGYEQVRSNSTTHAPIPTDEDHVPTGSNSRSRGFTADELMRMRRAGVFWIEARRLTQNLGRGNPGNQLMMRPLTRVFFGLGDTPVPRQTHLGEFAIVYDGVVTSGLSMEFAHNSMDRLNLPRPGSPGPSHYDNQTLVFARRARSGEIQYELTIASPAQRAALAKRSSQWNMYFQMPSGRAFGFVV